MTGHKRFRKHRLAGHVSVPMCVTFDVCAASANDSRFTLSFITCRIVRYISRTHAPPYLPV